MYLKIIKYNWALKNKKSISKIKTVKILMKIGWLEKLLNQTCPYSNFVINLRLNAYQRKMITLTPSF